MTAQPFLPTCRSTRMPTRASSKIVKLCLACRAKVLFFLAPFGLRLPTYIPRLGLLTTFTEILKFGTSLNVSVRQEVLTMTPVGYSSFWCETESLVPLPKKLLGKDMHNALNAYRGLWRIEGSFRVMKGNFSPPSLYLNRSTYTCALPYLLHSAIHHASYASRYWPEALSNLDI